MRPERRPRLADLQASFGTAVLDQARPTPPSLRTHGPAGVARRFSIYRNNVVFSLIDALRSRFPVAARIVGDEFFNEMARRFVLACPPTSAVLLGYGDGLAAFADRLPEVLEVPYLPDVLRLEAGWSQAFHAADALAATPEALAAVSPADLAELRIVLHPSMRLLRSTHPVLAIWAMNQNGAAPHALYEWCGDDVLIVRPSLQVAMLRLPAGRLEFLDALKRGHRLGAAVDIAVAAAPTFDVAAALAGLVSAGVATRFEL